MSEKYSVLLYGHASSEPLRYGLTARSDDGAKRQGREVCVRDCLADGIVVVERGKVRIGAWLNNNGHPLWVL